MAYANNNSISHSQFLELLCEDESNNRSGNNYNKRVYYNEPHKLDQKNIY